MTTYRHLTDGNPDGTLIGADVSELIGFHGATPSDQATGSAQSSAVFTKKVTGYGFTTSAKFHAFRDLVLAIRTALVEKGIIKGSS